MTHIRLYNPYFYVVYVIRTDFKPSTREIKKIKLRDGYNTEWLLHTGDLAAIKRTPK